MSEALEPILSERLAETVFLPLPDIARRARLWRLHVEEGDEQLTFRTPGGFVCGFAASADPINRAVILAMALTGGPLWPYAFPSLLDRVQRHWKQAQASNQLNKTDPR